MQIQKELLRKESQHKVSLHKEPLHNESLHKELLQLRKTENQITSQILEKLQLMANCRGYLSMGYSSLFDYLVRGLNYSESLAYQRQACVRLAKAIPEIKEKIDAGQLTYSTISLAYASVKNKPKEEVRQVLSQIENKSVREVKRILAEPAKPIIVKQTVYHDKVVLRLELSHEQNEKLQKLKALKSHIGGIETLFERLIDGELKKFENDGFKKSKSESRRFIPRRLRNAVLKAANYKCQFPGCEETHYLQVDHILPVVENGTALPENLQILCSAHNQWKGARLKNLSI